MNKRNKMMKYVIVAIAMFTFVGFTGCIDDEKNFQKEDEIGKSNDFDFSTKKTVKFTLKYKVSSGYRVHFEVYTKSPLALDEYKSYVKDTTLVPFFSGRCDDNGETSFKGDLPTTVNEIYAYSSAIGVPILMKASIDDSGTVSEFKSIDVPVATSSRATGNPSGTSSWKTYNVTLNRPTLPSLPTKNISAIDKNLIDQSFPENQNYDIVQTYYRSSIELNAPARVKIYSVNNGANSNRTNALAYFVYNNENEDIIKPVDVNSNLNLIFPKLNKKTPAEGEGFQLLYNGQETFEAGSRIGFALLPDIDPDNIKTVNTNVFYSCFNKGDWNVYSFPDLVRAGVPHMVMSKLREKDGHAFIAIAFEDQPWSTTHGTNRGDFRDDIFILEIDPATSLPGDLPTPPTDEPTYDAEIATKGILCFEDCWPTQGDYDLNDLVVAYEQFLCMSYVAGPVALKIKYTFLYNGATYRNGFGIQLMGLKRSDIMKCTIHSKYPNIGLDEGLDDAVVMLFDNGKNLTPGMTFDVYMSFSNGPLLTGVNPFIVVRGGKYGAYDDVLAQGRTEVHLATPTAKAMVKYLPTSKATASYWGSQDDKSIPAQQIFYVRESNYPFALDINWDSDKNGEATKFVIPEEGATIDKTYPDFIPWVKSGGKTNTDWYLHPKK